jgi:L-fuconolactonase
VAAHPEQRFILDHIAKPEIGGTFSDGWARGIRTLARHPNVVCKFSGVISEVRTSAWTRDQLWPYWETLIEAFGPTRMMFGSDWPVCLERTSYVEWFTVVREFSAPLSDAERGHLFEHTARTAYGLA